MDSCVYLAKSTSSAAHWQLHAVYIMTVPSEKSGSRWLGFDRAAIPRGETLCRLTVTVFAGSSSRRVSSSQGWRSSRREKERTGEYLVHSRIYRGDSQAREEGRISEVREFRRTFIKKIDFECAEALFRMIFAWISEWCVLKRGKSARSLTHDHFFSRTLVYFVLHGFARLRWRLGAIRIFLATSRDFTFSGSTRAFTFMIAVEYIKDRSLTRGILPFLL